MRIALTESRQRDRHPMDEHLAIVAELAGEFTEPFNSRLGISGGGVA